MGAFRTKTSVAYLAAALGLILSGADPGAVQQARKPITHTVTIDATRFVPEVLTIRAGDTVVWVNRDLIPHTATSKAGGFDSLVIATGKSWKYTLAQKGDFPYVCTFHPTMKGRLKVEGRREKGEGRSYLRVLMYRMIDSI